MLLFSGHGWSGNGELTTNGKPLQNLLILNVVITILTVILLMTYLYNFIKFLKKESDHKIVNKPVMATTFTMLGVSLLTNILGYVFYFGENVLPGWDGAETAFALMITFIVLTFVLFAATMIPSLFLLHIYSVGFDDEKIFMLGEKISYSKITKIMRDDSKKGIYVFYVEGKKANKRIKYSINSVVGQFVLTNSGVTGHPVEKGDADAYFKQLIQQQKLAVVEEAKAKAALAKKPASKTKAEEPKKQVKEETKTKDTKKPQ